MKLYLAGALFSCAERSFNSRLTNVLVAAGFEVWLPQQHEPREVTPKNIFLKDVEGIDWADAVLVNAEGADLDSGTCWEAGYAYGKGKPVYCYRSDFRGGEPGAPYNLMVSESAKARIELNSLAVCESELFMEITTMLRGES